jgi:hypothetical protein
LEVYSSKKESKWSKTGTQWLMSPCSSTCHAYKRPIQPKWRSEAASWPYLVERPLEAPQDRSKLRQRRAGDLLHSMLHLGGLQTTYELFVRRCWSRPASRRQIALLQQVH